MVKLMKHMSPFFARVRSDPINANCRENPERSNAIMHLFHCGLAVMLLFHPMIGFENELCVNK